MPIQNREYLKYIREEIPLPDVCDKLDLYTKGRGTNMRARCPFHNDQTPSLQIYADHFHCYVCRAHGDLFTLVKKVKGMDFQAALAWVEEQYPSVRSQKPVRSSSRRRSQTAAQIAQGYYASSEIKISQELLEERGYTSAFLRKSEVYQTNGRILSTHADREEQDGLLQAQLLQRDYSAVPDALPSYQDYFFKPRLLFTLRDMKRRVVGFAGRSLEGDKPKYLYTKGLPKDRLLYRMEAVDTRWNQSKDAAVDCCLYLVEGLFDALRLESLGMDAVSVLGSRLTDGQLHILEQVTARQQQLGRTLEFRCFLDSDLAGIEGAYQMICSLWRSDALRDTPLCVIFNPLSLPNSDKPDKNVEKDPDEFLKGMDQAQASEWIKEHRIHPLEFLLRRFMDRESLAFDGSPLEEQWGQMPLLQKVRILNQIANLFGGTTWKEILEFYTDNAGPNDTCYALELLNQRLQNKRESFLSDRVFPNAEDFFDSSYSLALEMARTGYKQEPMSMDDASWDRLSAGIEMVSRYFDRMLPNLFHMPPAHPLLAFLTPKDETQDRLKALPDHEELLLQQYLLNELLREEEYAGYARCIPAIRYDPDIGGTYTTGFGYVDTFQHTDVKAVSFAYQVDMSVLRLERHPTNGLFRHYYSCWTDFISFLRDGINRLEGEQIYRVKLDIRGYYDNIRKYALRDVLAEPLMEAFGYAPNAFRKLTPESDSNEDKQKKAEKVIDILLERLFGWDYLDPQTGTLQRTADMLQGIPQGPALSSYVANVLLFPLDRSVSQYINHVNRNCKPGKIRARYARYVDDMVILSSDARVLANIEEIIHTHLGAIQLELSPKTDHPDAVEKEEARGWLLDARGGLGVSGAQMIPEDTLDELWGTGYEPCVVDRHDALNILKSAADILASPGRFNEAFTACFRTENVRYRDAVRLAELLLKHLLTSDKLPADLYDAFSARWQQERQDMGILRSLLSRTDVEPLAFLDGLQLLLQRSIPATLPAVEQSSRLRVQTAAAQEIAGGTCIRKAEDTYRSVNGKNIAFLSIKILQLQALSQVRLSRPQINVPQTVPNSNWNYSMQNKYGSEMKRYLQRWQFMRITSQTDSEWEHLPLKQEDFPEDNDDFQLFHFLTVCLGCCTSIDLFRELRSMFMLHAEPDASPFPELYQIERIWFLPEESEELIPPEDARRALQALSNFLRQSYLPEVISRNPAMCVALFQKNGLRYLPVPPVPAQEAQYPGIFAVASHKVYRAEYTTSDKETADLAGGLTWQALPNSVYNGWSLFFAEWESGQWMTVTSPLAELPQEQWNPALAADIAELYEKLCDLIRNACHSPILSKYHLFQDPEGRLHALAYCHTRWTEPMGVALSVSGSSPSLKWQPLDKGPGRVERAAALLLEDLLELWRYPSEDTAANSLREVLSYGLGRLTGRRMRAHLSSLKSASFQRTVTRILEILRRFAGVQTGKENLLLLESALLDQLMSARLDWNRPDFLPGEDTAFLTEWAAASIQTESDRLREVMPQIPAVFELDFPMRRVVAAWRSIGCRLLWAAGEDFAAIRALGSASLLRAVSLDLRIRVLECVWALHDDEWQQLQDNPPPLALLQTRSEHAALLFNSNTDILRQEMDILEYMKAYRVGDGVSQLEQITPAGWYLLLAWILALDQDSVPRWLHPERWKRGGEDRGTAVHTIWQELGQFLFPANTPPEEDDFPYNGLPSSLLRCKDVDPILRQLHQLDEMLDFTIQRKCSDTLLFVNERQIKRRISVRLESSTKLTVPLPFVSRLLDGSKLPEYEGVNGQRVWTQTMQDGRALSISVVTSGAADLAWGGHPPLEMEMPPDKSTLSTDTQEAVTAVPEPAAQEVSPAEEPHVSAQAVPEDLDMSHLSFRKALANAQKAQQDSWNIRKNCNANIDRIAFFQFDVDDSYVHPLAECCVHQEQKDSSSFWKYKREPARWNREAAKKFGNHLYSCAEYRRRKLLEAVFSACEQFQVDVLLLPEYSVRMETVQWMLETIKTHPYNFSVWAGTCRLTPGRHYENEALCQLNAEKFDYCAPLPIICQNPRFPPNPDLKREYPMLYMGRSKKYPSISLEEVINPYNNRLQPVMKDPGQLGGQIYGDARDDVMELICAEVFLATNPGNMVAFAQVHDMLKMRFSGIIPDSIKANKNAFNDLYTIGERISLVQQKLSYTSMTGQVKNGLGKYGRTPILLVPAYTTRAVDYYVTGQAGYLATGLTTVFCNAVGLSSRGESCFIGTDCWERNNAQKSPFMPDYTIYHGALPGIYRQFDTKEGHGALGKSEQALVICDINPHAASGGRPKPESMMQPLTLVAHLPVIESVAYRKATEKGTGHSCGPYDQCRCERVKTKKDKKDNKINENKMAEALMPLLESLEKHLPLISQHKTTIYDTAPDVAADALERLGRTLHSPGLLERAECYRQFAKSNPQALPAATLLDWIWVDMDFPEALDGEKSPQINVPAFTDGAFQKPDWE